MENNGKHNLIKYDTLRSLIFHMYYNMVTCDNIAYIHIYIILLLKLKKTMFTKFKLCTMQYMYIHIIHTYIYIYCTGKCF